MASFSLDLDEDQLQIQKWVHDFAETVVRPAAHEWDEREETPWPIIEEAAKIGLYSWEFCANAFADPTGLTWPIISEEMCWGDAGIALAIFGSHARGVRHRRATARPSRSRSGCRSASARPRRSSSARSRVSEPDAGSDVSSLRTRAVYDEAKDEWVLNGTKTWITNGGIADVHVIVASVEPELAGAWPRELRRAAGHARSCSMGQKFQKHGIRASHTAEVILDDVRVPGQLPARRQGEARRAARPSAREGGSSGVQAAMSTFEATRPLVGAQADRHRARRVRVRARLREGARAVRSADHREPGHRVQARRHEDGDRRVAAARVARVAGWRTPARSSRTAKAR